MLGSVGSALSQVDRFSGGDRQELLYGINATLLAFFHLLNCLEQFRALFSHLAL